MFVGLPTLEGMLRVGCSAFFSALTCSAPKVHGLQGEMPQMCAAHLLQNKVLQLHD
jgi:hypothetical protein